jgi:hypothetical protein
LRIDMTDTIPDLHSQIMHLPFANPADVAWTVAEQQAAKLGHRDARHAAAELAVDADRRIEALAAEVQALRADAERYRYLRPRLVGADFDWAESGESVLIFKADPGVQVWADCDMTIDAARAALQGDSK